MIAAVSKTSFGSNPKNLERALERWEDDGGSDAPRQKGATDGHQPPACLPTLLPGYTTQVAGTFHDPDGVVHYELSRVYGPAEHVAGSAKAAASQLDEELSYWASSWPVVDPSGGIRPAGRWLTYADARDRLEPRLTFLEFSSVTAMHERIRALLGPAPLRS